MQEAVGGAAGRAGAAHVTEPRSAGETTLLSGEESAPSFGRASLATNEGLVAPVPSLSSRRSGRVAEVVVPEVVDGKIHSSADEPTTEPSGAPTQSSCSSSAEASGGTLNESRRLSSTDGTAFADVVATARTAGEQANEDFGLEVVRDQFGGGQGAAAGVVPAGGPVYNYYGERFLQETLVNAPLSTSSPKLPGLDDAPGNGSSPSNIFRAYPGSRPSSVGATSSLGDFSASLPPEAPLAEGGGRRFSDDSVSAAPPRGDSSALDHAPVRPWERGVSRTHPGATTSPSSTPSSRSPSRTALAAPPLGGGRSPKNGHRGAADPKNGRRSPLAAIAEHEKIGFAEGRRRKQLRSKELLEQSSSEEGGSSSGSFSRRTNVEEREGSAAWRSKSDGKSGRFHLRTNDQGGLPDMDMLQQALSFSGGGEIQDGKRRGRE